MLQTLRQQTDRLLADYQHLDRVVNEERTALEAAKAKVVHSQHAQSILQTLALTVQTKAHEAIAKLVSRCLKDVFGEEAYEFRIDFERKRGRTEAGLLFLRDDLVLENPKDESGGGAVEVASLALRIICLKLAVPKRRRVMIMDEILRNLNGVEYQERAGQMLKKLASDMGVQLILVSDDDFLKEIGQVIQL